MNQISQFQFIYNSDTGNSSTAAVLLLQWTMCFSITGNSFPTGTLPSNSSKQPMRIKDWSAVHSSDILLAGTKGLLHTVKLVVKK